jgi:CheY-like chemotaxis protein/HPt (histidine-containing phosphotransfer) domain-containing protein
METHTRMNPPQPLPLGGRVLIVEDHPVNQTVMSFQLEELGLDYAVAATGLAALDMLAASRFDLVLMDWQLPEMDGLEATRRIRRELRLDLPIIAVSANDSAGFRESCLEAGANDYLGKPYDEAQLATLLAHWLSTASPASPVDASPANPAAPSRELLDRRALAARYPNNPRLIAELASLFLRTSLESLAELHAAIAAGNADATGRSAHALRGAAASVLAGEVQALATDIETAAKTADWACMKARLAALDAIFKPMAQAS